MGRIESTRARSLPTSRLDRSSNSGESRRFDLAQDHRNPCPPSGRPGLAHSWSLGGQLDVVGGGEQRLSDHPELHQGQRPARAHVGPMPKTRFACALPIGSNLSGSSKTKGSRFAAVQFSTRRASFSTRCPPSSTSWVAAPVRDERVVDPQNLLDRRLDR